jgi:AcrR family transcriptional regulator
VTADWLFDAAVGDEIGYSRLTRDLAASRSHRSRRSQTAILAAAWQMFQEREYESVTMEDIAQRAGVSRPAVYSYFRSKRSIFLAISIAVNSRFQSSMQEFALIERGPSFDDELTSWVATYLKFLKEGYWTTLLWDRIVVSDERLRREGVRQQSMAWKTFGAHMQKLRGASEGGKPLAEGMIALSMLERVHFYWTLADSPFPTRELVRQVTTALKAMIIRDET